MEIRKKWKTKSSSAKEMIQMIVVTVIIIAFVVIGAGQTSRHSADEEQRIVEAAIKRAVVQCYALEGMYPPNIDYLEETYGLSIDEKKYIVHYEVFASNIMPTITVLRKQWEE